MGKLVTLNEAVENVSDHYNEGGEFLLMVDDGDSIITEGAVSEKTLAFMVTSILANMSPEGVGYVIAGALGKKDQKRDEGV